MRWDTTLGRVDPDGRLAPLFGSGDPSETAPEPPGSVVAVRADGTRRTLAPAGSAAAAVWALAARHGLDPRYPEAALREVERGLAAPGLDDPALVDRRALPLVTIDGASARDLDQAVYVERAGEGWRIDYALADASHYAPPGSALFAESLRRGASYYLPDLVIPMLPRAFSEGLVSLNPDVERRAMLFRLHLDAEGRLRDTEVERALVRSRAKLSFAEAQAFYDGTPGRWDDATIDASLAALRAVGEARMVLAEERDIVRYRRSEVRIGVDDPLGFITRADLRAPVERYNEQVSLLCNVAGARLLAATHADYVEPIFRVHPAPPAERVATFERFLVALARVHALDPRRWTWSRSAGTPLASFLEELPETGDEGRIAAAIHRQAVMLNVRSMFQEDPESHHGVGADVYARFTSPMREVVGIHLHHELFEALAGEGDIDPERRDRVVEAANAAKMKQKTVENEANALVLEQLFAQTREADRELSGTLMGLASGKAYIRLDEPPIDVKAYLRHQARFGGEVTVSDDGAELRRGTTRVARVGDPVRLRVHGPEQGRWVLELST